MHTSSKISTAILEYKRKSRIPSFISGEIPFSDFIIRSCNMNSSEALANDWNRVGGDMKKAIKKFDKQLSNV